MVCIFFGHRDCPDNVIEKLENTVDELINRRGVTRFYVGNHGNFDHYARKTLRKMKAKYPNISYYIVLAYRPKENDDPFEETILPAGIENVPKRFAISHRNRWMLNQADIVVGYVMRSYGGASTFFESAKRKKKECINLAEVTL